MLGLGLRITGPAASFLWPLAVLWVSTSLRRALWYLARGLPLKLLGLFPIIFAELYEAGLVGPWKKPGRESSRPLGLVPKGGSFL